MIRWRVESRQPADTWQEDGLHFFAFHLREDKKLDYTPFDPAVAVFVMTTDARQPVSAVTVTPDPTSQGEVITDLQAGRTIWRWLERWSRFVVMTLPARWAARRAPDDRWLAGTIPEHESSR